MHDRVYVQSYPMKMDIAAFISKVFDDSEGEYYVIMINSLLPEDKQKAALAHEIEHIYYGDYESELTADRLEFNALIRETKDLDTSYISFINDPFFEEYA